MKHICCDCDKFIQCGDLGRTESCKEFEKVIKAESLDTFDEINSEGEE